MKGKKFLYDKTNFDWSRKFMGGYTGDPVRRINDGHSEHSHLSNYESYGGTSTIKITEVEVSHMWANLIILDNFCLMCWQDE